MTQDNLLNADDQVIELDENKDYFAELVGEGKKFKDEKALAKAKAYSDAHIATLERQNEEYRQMALKNYETANAGAKLQELLDKLEATQQQLTSRETNPSSNEDTQPALKLDEVESLVSSKIQQHERTRTEQENFKLVEAKLKERHGNNYKSVLKQQSEALGLSDDDVNLMARRNPNLFVKTFDLNVAPQGTSFSTPPKGSPAFTPKGPEKRGWSYYVELKKKDPKAWLDKKTAIQMEKDAQALGEEFYKL